MGIGIVRRVFVRPYCPLCRPVRSHHSYRAGRDRQGLLPRIRLTPSSSWPPNHYCCCGKNERRQDGKYKPRQKSLGKAMKPEEPRSQTIDPRNFSEIP